MLRNLVQFSVLAKPKPFCNYLIYYSVQEVLLEIHGTELSHFIEDSLGTEVLRMSVEMAMDLYNISGDLVGSGDSNITGTTGTTERHSEEYIGIKEGLKEFPKRLTLEYLNASNR